jgi:succinyl-CoA synthetase beta subunit
MELHEYQTKSLLSRFGIPSPPFVIIDRKEEAPDLLQRAGFDSGVVKVQIHAGGRGKAGGVQLCNSREELLAATNELLNKKFFTNQTAGTGLIASKVLVTPKVSIEKELYIAVTIDRRAASAIFVSSALGGIEIESMASQNPKAISKEPIQSPQLHPFQLRRIIHSLGLQERYTEQLGQIIKGLITAFFQYDMELLEINPLVLAKEGRVLALDAKAKIDDNALYRQKELATLFDPTQVSAYELEAKANELSFISLEGNIGCMVNGAGLAMATMDLIKFWGGSPANFLDVGGSATEERILAGFRLLLKDPKIQAILVNIFGGIMNCILIAKALIQALHEFDAVKQQRRLPGIVVRMEGTHVDQAWSLLHSSKVPITIAKSFDEAAQLVVKKSKEVK